MKQLFLTVWMLIALPGMVQAQLIASYPLDAFYQGEDATGSYADLIGLSNNTAGPTGDINGLCLNGISVFNNGGQSWWTPSITGLSTNDFRVDMDFKINSYGNNSSGPQLWAFGRGCYAPLAVRLQTTGKILVLYNGFTGVTYNGFTYTLGQTCHLSIRHYNGTTYIYANGNLVGTNNTALNFNCSNKCFTQVDTLFGEGMNGCFKNFNIYNKTVNITSASDMTVTGNNCGATVSFSGIQSVSNSSVTYTFIPASGSFFNVGTHTVAAIADNGYTKDTSLFTLTVNQGPPTLTCGGDVNVDAPSGSCSFTGLSLFTPSQSFCPGGVSVTPTSNAPSVYPLGTTDVIWTASLNGHTSTCTQHVIVHDVTAPVITTCGGNITRYDVGSCGEAVNYTIPQATDCSGTPVITRTAGLASGSTFPVGITTVTHEAKDVSNNISTCSFTVTVIDTTDPVIVCPANLTVPAPAGQNSAIVNYTAPATIAECCILPNTVSGFSLLGEFGGHKYFRSNNPMTWTSAKVAAEAAGGKLMVINSAAEQGFLSSFSFLFNILGYNFWLGAKQNHANPGYAEPAGGWEWIDGTPFSYTNWNSGEPNNANSNEDHLQMTPSGTWNDNNSSTAFYALLELECQVTPVRTGGLASGSAFPLGASVVTYTATDVSGNSSSCSFTVTVVDTALAVIACLADITVPADPGSASAVVNYNAPIATDPYCTLPATVAGAVYLGTFNGHKYFRTVGSMGRSAANNIATDAGGHLASINSQAENSFIAGLIAGNTVWIGGIQDHANPAYAEPNGGWQWTDDSAFGFSNWNAGEPNNAGSGEDYIEMVPGGLWNDNSSSASHTAIIEFSCDADVVLVSGPPGGSTFPLGTTTVTYKATNQFGTPAFCSFNVTVTESDPPAIACQNDTIISVNGNLNTVAINYPLPVVSEGACTVPVSVAGMTYLGSLNGHNYFRTNTQMSWTNVRSAAATAGGRMAVVNSAAEQSFLTGILGGNSYWIGLFQNHSNSAYSEPGGGWEWIGGTPLTYTNWNTNEPNGTTDDHAEMFPNGKWNDAGAGNARYGLIEFSCGYDLVLTAGLPSGAVFPLGSTLVTYTATDTLGNASTCSFTVTLEDHTPPVVACLGDTTVLHTSGQGTMVVSYPFPAVSDGNCVIPDTIAGFLYVGKFNGHSYFRTNTTMNWTNAKNAAQAADGKLVVINNAEEQSFVTSILGGNPSWIGAFQNHANPAYAENAGGWEWIDGTPFTYTNWGGSEPNGGTNEDHVYLNTNGTWVDGNLNGIRYGLAEFGCGVELTRTSGLASGAAFPLGATVVTYKAVDVAGNIDSCSFTVNVIDTTAPVIGCSVDTMVVPDLGMATAIVNYALPAIADGGCLVPTAIPNLTYLGFYNGNTYFRTGTTMTWTNAKLAAESAGGKLVVVNTVGEQGFLAGVLANNSYWIGGFQNTSSPSYSENAGGWEWIDGTPFTYTNWAGTDPNGGINEGYLLMNANGTWADFIGGVGRYGLVEYSCGVTATLTSGLPSGSVFPMGATVVRYVVADRSGNTDSCSFTVTVADTTVPVVSCTGDTTIIVPAGQTSAVVSYATPSVANGGCTPPVSVPDLTYLGSFNGHTYFRTNTQMTWTNAKSAATAAGGRLAVINVSAEQAFLASVSAGNSFWIGAFQNHASPAYTEPAGGWEWVDGAPFSYTNWATSEPNNGGSEDNVIMNANGKWNDANGVIPRYGLVEFSCGYDFVRTAGLASGSAFPLGTTTVTHQASEPSGNSSSCSFNVTVVQAIVSSISASGPLTVCPGNSVTLTANGSGAYLWNTGDTTQSITVSQTGSYSVIVSDAFSADTSSVDVTVKAIPNLTILNLGSLKVCDGDNVLLKLDPAINISGFSCQWYKDGSPISGATATSYSTSVTGVYSLTVFSAGCSKTSASKTVSAKPAPIASVTTTGPLDLCQGQSMVLNANVQPGCTYKWFKDGVGIGNGGLVRVSNPGNYVVVADLNGCRDTSSSVGVTVHAMPVAAITSSVTNDSICSGSVAILEANAPVAGYSYEWNRGGVSLSAGVDNIQYNAGAAGSYRLVVTDLNGCSAASDVYKLRVISQPSANIVAYGSTNITNSGSVLLSANNNPAFSYQWYKDGNPVSGANLREYTATSTGTYTVAVSRNFCTAVSNPKVVTSAHSKAPAAVAATFELSAYPNPVSGVLTVSVSGLPEVNAILQITDISGKLIRTQQMTSESMNLDMSGLANGLYLIRYTDKAGNTGMMKVMKQ